MKWTTRKAGIIGVIVLAVVSILGFSGRSGAPDPPSSSNALIQLNVLRTNGIVRELVRE
jgi:hypothetical protein